MTDHNRQKKIALISDITGFGRCAFTVQLPVISMLRVQCCPVPTAILSNHTAFESHYMADFTPHMEEYIEQWKKLDLQFSGICTGFLGSSEQIRIVRGFIEDFRSRNTIVIVDPVMGDNGKAYKTCTEDICSGMAELVRHADITLPNVTEACILTGRKYKEHWRIAELLEMARQIADLGPGKVVITGIPQGSFIANFCYQKNGSDDFYSIVKAEKVGTSRFGTGDIYSAIISADAVNGMPLERSVRRASSFIKKCIIRSGEMDIPLTDGVCLEEVLHLLRYEG